MSARIGESCYPSYSNGEHDTISECAQESERQVPLLVTVNEPRRNRADVRAGIDD
jgi:hypothetical protein